MRRAGELVPVGESPDGGRQDGSALASDSVAGGEILAPLAGALVLGPLAEQALPVGAVVVRAEGGVSCQAAQARRDPESREGLGDEGARRVERAGVRGRPLRRVVDAQRGAALRVLCTVRGSQDTGRSSVLFAG